MKKIKTHRRANTYRAARRAAWKTANHGTALKIDWGAFRVSNDNPYKPFEGGKRKSDGRVSEYAAYPHMYPVNRSRHPGANPLHNPKGRERWMVKVPLDIATFDPNNKTTYREVKAYGPRNPSKYVPHQGAREIARRKVA